MDILSVFHILIGMAEKAVNAPPNFKEIIESIYDGIAGKRAALLNNVSLSKVDFTDELRRPGSEAQRQFNTMMTLIFAYHVAMLEYFQMEKNILELENKYNEKMAYLLAVMEQLAISRQNWEQGMLDDEQRRMIELMNLYQTQLQELKELQNHITSLSTRYTEVQAQLINSANIIHNITVEKAEKVTNVLTESTQKQVDAYDALNNKLESILQESIEKRTHAETQLARSDLTVQQREELAAQAAQYSDKIERYTQARDLIAAQKNAMTDELHSNLDKLDDAKERMHQAKEQDDLRAQVDTSLEVQLITEKMMARSHVKIEETKNTLKELSNLFLDEPELLSDLDHMDSLINSVVKDTVETANKYDKELNHEFFDFERLYSKNIDIQKEIKLAMKKSDDLQSNVVDLQRKMNRYNRHNDTQPQLPTVKDTNSHRL